MTPDYKARDFARFRARHEARKEARARRTEREEQRKLDNARRRRRRLNAGLPWNGKRASAVWAALLGRLDRKTRIYEKASPIFREYIESETAQEMKRLTRRKP